MVTWLVTTTATNWIYEKIIGSHTPDWVQDLYSSPGAALSFVITDVFTDAIPEHTIKDAAQKALKEAADIVKSANKDKNSDIIWILVKPDDEK